MPRLNPFRRAGVLGVALTAYDVWRRIPKEHRRTIVRQARRHGPKVAAAVIAHSKRRTNRGDRPGRS